MQSVLGKVEGNEIDTIAWKRSSGDALRLATFDGEG